MYEKRKFENANAFKKTEAFTRWNYQKEKVIEDDLPSKTDVIGYVDPNIRINEMIKAGLRIDAWNHALYSMEHDFIDPEAYEDYQENILNHGLDRMDQLSLTAQELDSYRSEMYHLYKNNLMRLQEAQKAPEKPPEANQKESVTQKNNESIKT